MFSHVINNPNNVELDIKDVNVIPIGYQCGAALACKYANIRKLSLPFDWLYPLTPNKIRSVLENNFDNFIPDIKNGINYNAYDIKFIHFNHNIDVGIEDLKRRIIRIQHMLNSNKKIYFIYVQDEYYFNSKHRNKEFDDNLFQEFLDFEYFIRNKYQNINYNILYINFNKHNIPMNSNIIEFVVTTDIFYDGDHTQKIFDFREYCGIILSEIFKTNTSFGHNHDIFYV